MRLVLVCFTFIILGCQSKTQKVIEEEGLYASIPKVLEQSEKEFKKIEITKSSEVDLNITELTDLSDQRSLGFVFGPGLYRTAGYINIIREIEKYKESAGVVTGHGVGAFFASAYAFNVAADLIEWKFFNFLSKVKNQKVFSESWIQAYEKMLEEVFSGKRIADAKIRLILPLYDIQNKKVRWLEEGKIKDVLMANVRMTPSRGRGSVAFPWEYYNRFAFENYGAERVISFNVLKGLPNLKRPNDLLMGLYSRGASNYQRSKEEFEISFELPLSKFSLDIPAKLVTESPDLRKKSKEIANYIQNIVQENIDQKVADEGE
ncbi:MAG: hypothetical protein ACPGJV_03720 [Bacteriovoracaceae bacterium]